MQFDVLRFFSEKRNEKYKLLAEQFLSISEVDSAVLFFFDSQSRNKVFTSGNLHPALFQSTDFVDIVNPRDEEQLIRQKLREVYPLDRIRVIEAKLEKELVALIFLGVTNNFEDRNFIFAKNLCQLIELDIETEARELETKLKENSLDAFFRLGLVSTDIFLELDLDGKILFANRAFNKNLGYTREQVIGQNILDFVFEDDLESNSANLRHELLGKKYLNDWRGRLVSYDSKKIWHSFTGIVSDNKWFAIARDINDLIYFDHQLIKERERFKFFTESSFEGIALEVDGQIIDCNRMYLKIFKAELADVIRQPSDKFIAVDDLQAWRNTIKDESLSTYEVEAKTREGDLIHIEVNRKPAFHKGSKGKLVAIRDITQRKKLEKELDDRTSLHRSIVENDHILFSILDASGKVLEFSSGMHTMLGTRKENVIGKPLHEVLNSPIEKSNGDANSLVDDQKSGKKIYLLKSDSTSYDGEISVTNAQGEWCELRLTIDHLTASKNDKQLVVFKDVTDIKSNLVKLEQAKEELRNTIKSAKLASWHYDFATWKLHLAPESLNILNLDKLEYSFEEFLSKIHPEDVEEMGRQMQYAFEGKEFKCDARIVLQGKPRYIHIQSFASKQPITSDYKPVIKGILQDVSERKRQEIELKEAKQKAEQHTRAKNLFLANMSHEIRTPLNSILGFSQVLENKIKNPGALKLLGAIKNSGDTLLKLINDILDLSKIESSKISLHKEDFSLRKLLEYQSSLFKTLAKSKKIEFKINTPLHKAHLFHSDFYRINQIVMNLINNSIKFTNTGFVELFVDLEKKENKSYLYFKITDSGIGIDKKAKELVFKTFEQANTEITRKFGGTGLGLAIVKGLVDLLDGKIELESELGKGTVFHVRVQVEDKGIIPKDVRTESAAHEQPALSIKKPFRVLLAEDNPTNQLLMQEVFKQLDIDFEIAHDGVEALDILKSDSNFQMGIFDIQMPNMDGTTAVRNIRNNEDVYPQFPIIALTADATTQEKKHALENGFSGFLPKPFIIHELIEKINELFANASSQNLESGSKEIKKDPSYDLSWSWKVDMTYMEQVTNGNAEAIVKILERCVNSLPEKIDTLKQSGEDRNLKSLIDTAHAVKGQITLFVSQKDQDYITNCYQKLRNLNAIEEKEQKLINTLAAELKHLKNLL
ncbi:MAG: PAS domain S-box protein, partial [Luteibaculum sp.]